MIGNYKILARKTAKTNKNVVENTVIIAQAKANVNSKYLKNECMRKQVLRAERKAGMNAPAGGHNPAVAQGAWGARAKQIKSTRGNTHLRRAKFEKTKEALIMKQYSTPEVIFDKFTTEEIAISLGSSVESADLGKVGASVDFGDLTL